ncbi:MAG: DNA polymerase III subunit gamma/tau [Acidobacteria bacterium]|nr:DNA polymerase III subunit gamma/tau [Acidobacteriota bacterium]MCA1642303.1 DNA polymerase III subunit gamma/tau [Acidobacteriota bacterium]
MSYQVIARKWRPQAFEEVTGQEPITRTLRNAIEHDRLHHAYIFSGARGVGKTTTARLLAKALNCHKSDRPTPTPCRADDPSVCASCREVGEGRSIDVLEIDAASNTGVDNVRESIINTVGVRPARDRFKVFIIDEVHMLSGAAFNALLKTLEEPPPRVVFVMATTESHKIPDTILSRSQQFEFRTIATQKIGERLRLIADAEKIKIEDSALREIARAGEGSMRDAQSAFDQVISFSEGAIKAADVEAALGIAGVELRSRVMRAVAAREPKDALAVVDDLVIRGHDLRNFCRDLLAHVRDLLVTKAAGGSSELMDATEAERGDLVREASEFSESDLVRFFHSLTETEQRLREGAHPRYQLEIGLVKLIEMRRLAPVSQILERLNALEEALRTGRSPATGSPTPTGGASSGGGGTASRGGSGGGSSAPPNPRFPKQRADGSQGRGAATSRAKANGGAGAADDTPPWESAAPASAPVNSSSPPLRLVEPQQSATAGAAQPDVSAQPDESPQPDGGAPPGADGFSLVSTQAPPRVEFDPHAQQASAPDSFTDRLKNALEDRRKPFLATALDGARKVEVRGDELCVEFAPDAKFLRDNLSKPENARLVREACSEIVGREVGIQIAVRDERESAEAAAEGEEQAARRSLREMAEQDSQVQDVLRIFRAEIVDVRPGDKA